MVLGKKRIRSLRKTYTSLSNGEGIPKRTYKFRVDAAKLSTVFSYLMERLQVRPGLCRPIVIGDHKIDAMPVYNRGGISLKDLTDEYVNIHIRKNVLATIYFGTLLIY